jgi:pimeloyl-ACP methyl ester carboxylesterase
MPSSRQRHSPPVPKAPDLVDPAFILKGFGVVFLVALALAYTTLCVVYSRSQWQLVLHPSRTLSAQPAAQGLHAEEVHFGVDASGQPQLDGWWIPSDSKSGRTVLMLHGADGNMADALPMAAILHSLNLSVLLFDYRGYGRSGGDHPAQATMQQDAHSALSYLMNTRDKHAMDLIVYGYGLGAPLALDLCATSQIECPAALLDSPDGDTLDRASQDIRSRAVPAAWLFRERFPLATPLAASPAPTLFIFHNNNRTPAYFQNAREPKMAISIQPNDIVSLRAGIQRFLDDHHPSD